MAGVLGAILLFIIQMGLESSKRGGPPAGVVFANRMLHLYGPNAMVAGAMVFCLAGVVWGIIYVIAVPKVAPVSGLLFSVIPSLCALLIVPLFMGMPLLAGGDAMRILVTFCLNALWGAFVGLVTPRLATVFYR